MAWQPGTSLLLQRTRSPANRKASDTTGVTAAAHLLLVLSGVHHVHRDNIVEEVAKAEDEIVVEDVVALGEDVAVTLFGHGDAGEAGKEGEGAAGELVPNVQDAVGLDPKVLAEPFAEAAVLEEGGEAVEDEGEEGGAEDKLGDTADETRLVHPGVKHAETGRKNSLDKDTGSSNFTTLTVYILSLCLFITLRLHFHSELINSYH